MTDRMKAIESEYGKPIEQVLMELYEKHGSQSAVAESLGVSQPTLSFWLIRLGLEQTTVLKPVSQSQRGA